MLCAAPTLMGCLVTDKIDFEGEKNYPPVILDKPNPDYPIGGVIRFDLDADATTLSFPVIVRDENVRDDLDARVRIVTDGNRTPRFTPDQTVQQTGEVEREFRVTVQLTELKPARCYQLELAVSGSFLDPDNPVLFEIASPRDDIALASWLMFEGGEEISPDEAKSIVDSCVSTFLVDEGAPVEGGQ